MLDLCRAGNIWIIGYSCFSMDIRRWKSSWVSLIFLAIPSRRSSYLLLPQRRAHFEQHLSPGRTLTFHRDQPGRPVLELRRTDIIAGRRMTGFATRSVSLLLRPVYHMVRRYIWAFLRIPLVRCSHVSASLSQVFEVFSFSFLAFFFFLKDSLQPSWRCLDCSVLGRRFLFIWSGWGVLQSA